MRKELPTKRAGPWTLSAERAATVSMVRRSDVANGAECLNGSPFVVLYSRVVSTRILAGGMIGQSSLKAFRGLAPGRSES